jgi:hypothetical protein
VLAERSAAQAQGMSSSRREAGQWLTSLVLDDLAPLLPLVLWQRGVVSRVFRFFGENIAASLFVFTPSILQIQVSCRFPSRPEAASLEDGSK